MSDSSVPSFTEFYPHIRYQKQVIDDVFINFDYSQGVHEILLSGSAGSAKSLLMAHCLIRHLLTFKRARGCIGRFAMPDLRDTLFARILEHLEGTTKPDGSLFREGHDFGWRETNCSVWFSNGSEILARSWADKKFKKLGSTEFSVACIEELTENEGEYWGAIQILRSRVGRLPHVPQSWIMYATNPDAPSHPAYEYFQIGERQQGMVQNLKPMRHVYFSLTKDNPFLPSWYTDHLESTLDPKMARRLVHGEWIEITQDVVYYAYGAHNFSDSEYQVDPLYPIYLSFDFNIGRDKPLSAVVTQAIPDKNGKEYYIHAFDEFVLDGADTLEMMEEIGASDILDYETDFIVNGDATGGARSTQSKLSNYDIIKQYLNSQRRASGKVDFQIQVPLSNPPIRARHNLVNAYCRAANGKVKLTVYRKCKTLDKGMRLTALKKGGNYIEDDSKPYQHITTALGYHIHWVEKNAARIGKPNIREAAIR